MGQSEGRIRLVSSTFSRHQLDLILEKTRPFTETGHYLYPADADGNHTAGFFAIEPVTRSTDFVHAIADDMAVWANRSVPDVDAILAPAQPAVRALAEAVGSRLGAPTAYWEYMPSGRFGDRIVDGSLPRESRNLALNGMSLQGRCVGLRLPQFIERLGGTVAGATVFAKGVADLVTQTERRLGDRFYSTVQVEVPIYSAAECPLCASAQGAPVSWRAFAEAAR